VKAVRDQTIFFKTCLGVFQGGGCRGAAFVGAYEEAVSRGVHFTEVAGTSSGSIAAALIGAGATPEQLRERITELDFGTFLRDPENLPNTLGFHSLAKIAWLTRLRAYRRFFSHLGRYSSVGIEEWVEEQLRSLLPNERTPIRFESLPIPTWIVATDLGAKGVRVWSSEYDKNAEVAKAVRASCSIPIFFQPVNLNYVDGGLLSNLPSFVFSSAASGYRPLSSRILAFTLQADPDKPDTSNAFRFLSEMVDTLVDGSQDLQLRIQSGVHVIQINTGSVKATDFEKIDEDTRTTLIREGSDATAKFFTEERTRVYAGPPQATLCYDPDQTFSAVVENLEQRMHEIVISEENAEWVYSVYPALLHWRGREDVPITVLLNKAVRGVRDSYCRRLLAALGARVFEVSSVPVRSYLFDPDSADEASAVVRIPPSEESSSPEAVQYRGAHFSAAIAALRDQIKSLCYSTNAADYRVSSTRPSLSQIGEDVLLKRLRAVSQYEDGNVDLAMDEIRVLSMISLTKFVRECKYRQVGRLMDLYSRSNIRHFLPAQVDYGPKLSSMITPPVVERGNDGDILIQGTTRAVFCRDNNIPKIQCVVVSNVAKQMPTHQRIDLRHVRVAGRAVPYAERYGEPYQHDYRNIEVAIRPETELQ
jgi:predicted acylesterase/phospholipase RssA